MASYATNWEDDDCSRIVQLSVEYQLVDDRVEIEKVTPTAVQFLNTDGTPGRKIHIWTETARQILRQQHELTVGASQFRQQIETQLVSSAV